MSGTQDPKIEDGIPVPRKEERHRSMWASFAVGQSAFFAAGNQQRLQMSARSWAMRQSPPCRFTTQVRTEDGVRGVRVWRIA